MIKSEEIHISWSERALPRRWLEPSLTEKKEPALRNSGDSKFSVVGMAGTKALRQDSEKARWH